MLSPMALYASETFCVGRTVPGSRCGVDVPQVMGQMLGGGEPWTWQLLAQRTLGTVMVTVTGGCQGCGSVHLS